MFSFISPPKNIIWTVHIKVITWHCKYLLTVIFNVLFISTIFCVDRILQESARWLIAKGRFEEADVVIRSIAKANNTTEKLPQNYLQKLQNTCVVRAYRYSLFIIVCVCVLVRACVGACVCSSYFMYCV